MRIDRRWLATILTINPGARPMGQELHRVARGLARPPEINNLDSCVIRFVLANTATLQDSGREGPIDTF